MAKGCGRLTKSCRGGWKLCVCVSVWVGVEGALHRLMLD